MSDFTKLEAGKTYVFKDELACILWSDIDENDYIRSEFYDDGFAIDEVYEDDGYICDNCVIGMDELQYFKLKEEKTMQQPKHIRPDDEVTITTTYGELARAYAVLGKVGGRPYGADLWSIIGDIIDDFGSVYSQIVYPKDLEGACKYPEYQKEWLAALFPEPAPVESPTQRKARELREQAELLLVKARELEESVG